MEIIPLTKGCFAMVDDEDYEDLNKFKWYTKKGIEGGSSYARSTKGSGYMHRRIMNVSDKKIIVDHIDGNGLNNQKSNLRICTSSQNNRNRKPDFNSTSKYLGVYFLTQTDKRIGKDGNPRMKIHQYWVAQIMKENIGRFPSEEAAALAYNKRATEIHGEFARLNIITETLNK